MPSRSVQRYAAVGLLIAVVSIAGTTAWSWADSYAEGQREIVEKQEQLRSLRDLADARRGFGTLTRRTGSDVLILPADAAPQDALATAIAHAADGQQVVLDSVEAMPAEATQVSASVRLRGTQSGLYAVLHALGDQTPYLIVPRLDIALFRAADPDGKKPLILGADIRVAALTAPTVIPRPSTAPTP